MALKNVIPVLPGQNITVVVGAGGVGEGAAGSNSSFGNLILALGGAPYLAARAAAGQVVQLWRCTGVRPTPM